VGAAKKQPEPEETGTWVANLQKVGAYRLHGKTVQLAGEVSKLGEMIEIPAGEERLIPKAIWDRYKDRPDVLAADRSKILVGGFKAASPAELESDDAQRAVIKAHQATMDAKIEELKALKAEIEDLQSRGAAG
jgi:hypothetical protein